MDKNLLAQLVCPQCHQDINFNDSTKRIDCLVCHLAFPIVDEIPVMLIEEALPIDDSKEALKK